MVNTIFILDKGYNTTRILVGNRNSQKTFWDDTYTQELDTGAETFEFSCVATEEVKEGNYVIFLYNNQYKMFTIMDTEEEHKDGRLITHCYCEIAALSLINHFVRKFSGDMNCIQFFQHILQDTGWTIGQYNTSLQDRVETIDVSKATTVWSLIEDYKDIFECEINARVTYDNGTLTGQYIDIYSEGNLGTPTLKRFEYGRNVSGIVKQKDLYDWCTAIIVDCNCDVSDTIIEEKDGFGFVKGAGDVILDDNHNRMYNAGKNYVVGVYSGEETEPVEACINAWKELKKRSVPKFDYEVTTALTSAEYEDVHLGDTVHVIDYSYTPPLFLEARVGKLELSFTDSTANKCTLTNYKEVKSKLLDADYIKLTGTISDIVNAFFPIGPEGIQDGAIVDGKIDTVYFQEITADIVSASIGAFEDLYVGNMTVINADIQNLRAETAEIGTLKAQVAEINTLINGHLTSDNIQSLILTAGKVTVDDAFIKDAMIDTISANKITAGRLNTSLVNIQSEDGGVQISGSLQQFRDKEGVVRIQIGKDAQGNFTFALFSQDGIGVLIDETGIKEGAIGDGIIVDDMVSDDANIQGGKLDINSVITSINNGTTTINSSRVFLDGEGQSLQVAFDALKTKVETLEDISVDGDLSSVIEQVISNTTSINIMQGEISSLIANTTITKENGEVVQLKDEYNITKSTVNSLSTKIGSLETTVDDVTSKQSSLELDLEGFRTEVSDNYATKDGLEEVSEKQSSLELGLDGFKVEISDTYATKEELEGVVTGSGFVSRTEFEQSTEDFTFKIKQSGNGNLLRNTKFRDGNQYWTLWCWDTNGTSSRTIQVIEPWASWNNNKERALRIDAIPRSSSSFLRTGVHSAAVDVQPNETYTFSCYVSSHRVNKLHFEAYTNEATGTDSLELDLGLGDSVVCGSHGETDIGYSKWERVERTFTVKGNTTQLRIHIYMNQHDGNEQLHSCMWIALPCLVQGDMAYEWVPHESELYDGIVRIDKDGLTVSQGRSKTVLDSTALSFYDGSNRYSHVEDGRLYFTNPSGTKVGHVGRQIWTGSQKYLTGVNANFGQTCALGVQEEENGDYTSYIIATGNSQAILDAQVYQGINLTNPHISGPIMMKPVESSKYTSGTGITKYGRPYFMMYAYESNDVGRIGMLVADNRISQCIMSGDNVKVGLEVVDVTNTINNVAIDAWGPINMHGFNVAEASLTSSMSARTDYTQRVLNSGSIENTNYSSLSYYSDEIRWCFKETVFTYPEADIDPETDEWVYTGRNICYIELPIFMAENIEDNYHVQIGKIGWGDYRVVEKNPYYFIVESQEEDFAFTFEVVAKLQDGRTTDNNAVVASAYVRNEQARPLPTCGEGLSFSNDTSNEV